MLRFTRIAMSLAILGCLAATTALAQNGHYITLSPSISGTTGCYNITLKEAGLGNSGVTSVSYDLSATATFTAACFTKKGHVVQGQPKSGSGSASSITTLQVRNGSTQGTVSICPAAFTLPDPGCTGSQILAITSASYTNVTLNDQLASDVTAGVQTLPDLSATDLFVIP